MSRRGSITGDQLTNALRALNVNFILGGHKEGASLHRQPARLIAALAESDDARLRLSLIALFLDHPEFAGHVHPAANEHVPLARLTLLCYYSAAVWIERRYRSHSASLPDYFSGELNLHPGIDPEENLRALANRQRELSEPSYQAVGTLWELGVR